MYSFSRVGRGNAYVFSVDLPKKSYIILRERIHSSTQGRKTIKGEWWCHIWVPQTEINPGILIAFGRESASPAMYNRQRLLFQMMISRDGLLWCMEMGRGAALGSSDKKRRVPLWWSVRPDLLPQVYVMLIKLSAALGDWVPWSVFMHINLFP